MLYEIQDIARFPRVQEFLSYCRLVKPGANRPARSGAPAGKIGNAHLKWAFGELATTFLRAKSPAQRLHQRLKAKHGKGKALSVLAAKLARAVYFQLKPRTGIRRQEVLSGLIRSRRAISTPNWSF